MKRIAVIGLGYVGLPLALAFGEKYLTVGFDISEKRIHDLRKGLDFTNEVDPMLLKRLNATENSDTGVVFTSNIEELREVDFYIVTVPTPVDNYHRPDLSYVISASEIVGKVLNVGDCVVYESTGYPGMTEEICVPALESTSSLRFNKDFFVGYSPERVNPGDKEHAINRVVKVVSGSTPEVALMVKEVYDSIVEVGTYMTSSIRVAEAAKVIENTQRDINIAFVNELYKIFRLMDIDTHEVLEAASTKWNFMPFKPGLVGGHCIGVDPYYLAQKAQEIGYHPELILAGRRVNDGMGDYYAHEIVREMIQNDIPVKGAKVLILGITFKENCPDIRNTKVVDLIYRLRSFGCDVAVYDPWADPKEVAESYQISSSSDKPKEVYDYTVLAVAHHDFKDYPKIDFSIKRMPTR
ncbi:MAG: nucleotide sugar dehydrogenase [Prolixibacteraceae bacterium]